MNKFIILSLTLFLLVGAAQAAPAILTWENDVTNDISLKPMVSEGQTVVFNVSVVDVNTHHWYKNGIDQNHDFDNYSASWVKWGDVAEVIYFGEGAAENTTNLTWNPYIVVVRATSTAIPVNITRSNEFVDATDEMDIEKMLAAEMYLFTDTMGVFFFLFIIGIPMVMIYVRTDSLLVPGIIGTISSIFMLAFLPVAYQVPGVLLIVVSIAAVFLKIFKERTS